MKQSFIVWTPWLAVIFGSLTLFSYAVVDGMPEPVSHLIGREIVTQSLADFVLFLTFYMFIARVIVVALREPIFVVTRVILLQIPLTCVNFLPFKVKRQLFKHFLRFRLFIDALYLSFGNIPMKMSCLIGLALMVYKLADDWKTTVGMAVIIVVISTSGFMMEGGLNRKLRVRFSFRKHKSDLKELKQVSYSTALLALAFFAGASYQENLFIDAQEIIFENTVMKLVFLTGDFAYLVDEFATKPETVETWALERVSALEIRSTNF
ncbi:MAG: hypothetical protein V7661_01930 [Sulfitobacter sp.]